MSRKKIGLIAAGSLATLLLLAGAAAVLVLRSTWFHEKIRATVVETVETATGGRAEIGSFQFDWKEMRVELRQFALHGSEPSDKPPLLRAASVAVGLTIVSLLTRDVSVRYLDVRDPTVYLIIHPDGHTNIPEPRVKQHSEQTPFDTLVNLAIGRFSMQNGRFEVEGQTRTPFDARGRNLGAKFTYEFAASRYRGDLSIQPLDLQWDGQTALPLGVQMAVTLEKNRIGVSSARLTTGESAVDFSGAVENLVSPRASFRYQAHAMAVDVSRLFRIRGLERGTAELRGNFEWAGASDYSLTGNLHALEVEFLQSPVQLRNLRMNGALRVDAKGANLSDVRLSGESVNGGIRTPVEARIAGVTVHGKDLDLRGLSLQALGGGFAGEGRIEGYDRFHLRGALSGLDARRAVALYSRAPLPWDSLVSGPVEIEGSARRSRDLRITATLTLAPAQQGPPVRGQIAATYDARTDSLDVGRSTLALPSSRVDLSGAIGRQMQVHLETRDLNDFLPALGESAASIPLKLENGSALFDGTVTGQLQNLRIAGRLIVTRFAYAGKSFDGLQTDVSVSPGDLQLQHGALTHGAGHAQFQLTLGLRDWKAESSGSLSGNGTIRNAALADLVALAGGGKDLAATGTANVNGQVAGTIGDPHFNGDLEVVKGSFQNEPFDRFAARITDTGRSLQVASGQLIAGVRQVRIEGSFDHQPSRFDAGHLRFQVQSNALPLDGIRALERVRPGIKGTAQVTANGALDVSHTPNGTESFRLVALQADVLARGLQLTGQPLGDAHLIADSQGSQLRAHLDSSLANSTIRGDGEWRLDGDYPGSATISFSKLDLASLRDWIAPSTSSGPSRFTGFAEGEIRVTGPARKPELMTATLRIPNFEVQPSADAKAFSLRNSGPIVATLANSVITIDSAKLTGRSTDFTVTGKVSLQQKSPLDLRVSGHADLGLLQMVSPDITSSGMIVTEASLRGPFSSPQLNGRLELADASFSYAPLPNGVTNASGVILFTDDQATIQNLAGETGGGKIQLSGFAGYGEGAGVFRLHADTQQVRIRYPEGVSTVTDASLNLTGTSERSMLAGTITIRRASVNLESDFGALLAKSAEPVRTPASRTGILGGLNYDVQIQTAPDIQFESVLTQGLQADANLRLRGTASNPALLGRVNITQGRVVFFGTKYTINQGSISFFNPVKVEPVLNVDLETKARGIDITLAVSGPLSKLNLTPRSDPPLQFNEIVSVLTTGQDPTTDTARLGQQAGTPQPFQQSAASALLGQAIASPVSGRLQRFFGVSKLRIDPTLPGVEYNPQARLTLEQQVTPDITFTYITNVTNANPQVVSVEWALSKQWSVFALREENGLFGLDFFFKKRFK